MLTVDKQNPTGVTAEDLCYSSVSVIEEQRISCDFYEMNYKILVKYFLIEIRMWGQKSLQQQEQIPEN